MVGASGTNNVRQVPKLNLIKILKEQLPGIPQNVHNGFSTPLKKSIYRNKLSPFHILQTHYSTKMTYFPLEKSNMVAQMWMYRSYNA